MTRKEEIIFAALELASEKGLKSISLSQIADKVGIKKPSLYNHFASKDELISEMYIFLRNNAQSKNSSSRPDYTAFFAGKTLEEICYRLRCIQDVGLGYLTMSYMQYSRFVTDKDMLNFFRILYSERSTSPAAAQIMLEETQHMISSIKELFYALAVHGKMKNEDVDTASLAYAMALHSLTDMHMDMMTSGKAPDDTEIPKDVRDLIKWFSEKMKTEE